MNDIGSPEVLVPGFFFTTVVLIVYFITKTISKERFTLIEKGIMPTSKRINNSLKQGLLIVGVGLGIFIGVLISQVFDLEKRTSFAISASLSLILGGLGLIIFYLIDNQQKNHAE